MQNQQKRKVIQLDGKSLTIKTLDQIVRQKLKIDLSPDAWKIVERSRQAINKMMADPNKAVYGITTGFGSFANVSISRQERQRLQLNLIRSHAVGVGKPVPLDIVRRMFVLRINTLAKGRSGIRTQNLQIFIEAFNADFLPLIPEQGTVGASGDLAPLSHLALGLLGEGLAWDAQKQSYESAESVLNKLKLKKLLLKQKQGLALINGTQFMASIVSEVAQQVVKLFNSSLTLYALAVELFGVQTDLFSKQNEQLYKQFNIQLGEVIQRIRSLIGEEPSILHQARKYKQEVNSLLDCPEALAGILKSIRFCRKLIEQEMNSATDNPLVYFQEDGFKQDELISAGNFHGQYVAKASDFLGVAIFELGKFSEARIQKYINCKVSRLPPFLIKNGGLNSGFMISQYTTAALLSESKVLVNPASVDSITTSAGQEDHVSMGGFAARKSKLLLDNIAHIHGVELLMVITAVQLLQLTTSEKLTQIINEVRKTLNPLLEDRFYSPDMKEGARLVLQDISEI